MADHPHQIMFGIHGDSVYCPPAELVFWHYLKTYSRITIRFGRDILVGEHIVSLCSRAGRVAVEYDLPPRDRWTSDDKLRIDTLLMRGYTIVNVSSPEVYSNPEAICELLVHALEGSSWTGDAIRSEIMAVGSRSLLEEFEDDLEPQERQGRLGRREATAENMESIRVGSDISGETAFSPPA